MSGFPISLDVVAIKATMVLVGAMLVAHALRRASGSSRHTLWTATTLALLALPVLHSNLPRLPLAWLPLPVEQALTNSPDIAMDAGEIAASTTAADRLVELPATGGVTESAAPPSIAFWFGAAWLVGVIAFAIPVLLGLVRSRRVMARATDVHDDRLQDHFAHARQLVAAPAEVSLRLSPEIRTPMTGGILHPVVLLPESAVMWGDECLAAVLRHELVHVRQRDALRQLGSRLSVALYWFHPLAWRAARLGALAREMACDESVLRLGTRPSRYARHLLALADPLPAPMAPALVRLDHPHLEERVMAILRASPPPASRRLSVSAALLIFSWTAAVAAAAPGVSNAAAESSNTSTAVTAEALPADVGLPPLDVLSELPTPAPLQVPVADCELEGGSRARATSGGGESVRMMNTEVEGTRICVTIRGDNQDRATFLPRGRLAAGVLVTLASANDEGVRRLEISGTERGNQHRWFVDGREQEFNGAAAEWRDAMYNMIDRLSRASEADRSNAVVAAGRARAQMEAARASRAGAVNRLAEVERRAAERARVAEEVEAVAGARMRAVESARVAGRVARQVEGELAVAGVGGNRPALVEGVPEVPVPPRVAMGRGGDRPMIEQRRHAIEAREALREHAQELRARAMQLERERAELRRRIDREVPVVVEGRPARPPVAPRAPMLRREAELDANTRNASERLRRAIRDTDDS